jgi:MoxR-like ATPase
MYAAVHMLSGIDPERFDAAASRFTAFFTELGKTFVEREELLTQIALGLLGREHCLMTGPPGTAKSGIASAVLRRIVDESSRAPSLFARQFTESTVQTDLVGPINFKTLMETGRTEHFTDEGMLGAVHAFLDEVFDGRDMLLRSTLNVLQERELKQGGKTTRGQIECALMTTNRYLAEVLEGSRETLLAFVDRIAFVSFVPKGFGDPASLAKVLKRQIGQAAPFTTDLTIQDLDVLQAVVEAIPVPDSVLERLGKLLALYDEELAAASRSDPHFLPTRYLSTRTAVRLGKLLRSVCMFDRLFTRPERLLEVDHVDLNGLRFSLVLAGPSPKALGALLKTETDPRERRQLSTVRTEREIFERCIQKLPSPPLSAPKKQVEAPEAARLRHIASSLPTQEVKTLVAATQELTAQANAPPLGAVDSEKLLRDVVAELSQRALAAGVRAPGATMEKDALAVAQELGALADEVESAAGATRPIARWLRGRALAIIDEAARLGAAPRGATLDVKRPEGSVAAKLIADDLIGSVEALAQARKRIAAQGALDETGDDGDAAWKRALERLETEVALLLDDGLRADMEAAMAKQGDELEALVLALAEPLDVIDRCAARLTALSKSPSALKPRVVGPRLRPLVAATFARISAPDRVKLVAQVDRLLNTLAATSLSGALASKDIVEMTADTLVRSAGSAPRAPETPLDRNTYRKLRAADHRVPGAFTLLEIALRLGAADAKGAPDEAADAITALAHAMPAATASSVASLDVARIGRFIGFLEKWWVSLSERSDDRLAAWTSAGFFHVVRDEQAFARTALECRLVRDVFPEVAGDVDALLARLDALDKQTSDALAEALKSRSDAAWSKTLGART